MPKAPSNRSLVKFEGDSKPEKKPASPVAKFFSRYSKGLTPHSKRRRRDGDRDVRSASRRHGGDDATASANDTNNTSNNKMGLIPSILTFIDAHPSLPNTLSIYVQFVLNLFFACCLMFILYGIFATIRNDIDEKAMIESSDILAEMAACAHEFKENRCERETRVPAMETVCNGWERCMQRDPYKVGRSRLSAGMFAEIFNSFIEPISLKAIVSLLSLSSALNIHLFVPRLISLSRPSASSSSSGVSPSTT